MRILIEAGVILIVVLVFYYPVTILWPSGPGDDLIFPIRWRIWILGYICGTAVCTVMYFFKITRDDA